MEEKCWHMKKVKIVTRLPRCECGRGEDRAKVKRELRCLSFSWCLQQEKIHAHKTSPRQFTYRIIRSEFSFALWRFHKPSLFIFAFVQRKNSEENFQTRGNENIKKFFAENFFGVFWLKFNVLFSHPQITLYFYCAPHNYPQSCGGGKTFSALFPSWFCFLLFNRQMIFIFC